MWSMVIFKLIVMFVKRSFNTWFFYLDAFLRIFGFSDQFYMLFGTSLTKKFARKKYNFGIFQCVNILQFIRHTHNSSYSNSRRFPF
jgi:hypothetical protein